MESVKLQALEIIELSRGFNVWNRAGLSAFISLESHSCHPGSTASTTSRSTTKLISRRTHSGVLDSSRRLGPFEYKRIFPFNIIWLSRLYINYIKYYQQLDAM